MSCIGRAFESPILRAAHTAGETCSKCLSYIERFNRPVRHEWLDEHLFATIEHAQETGLPMASAPLM
jgi:hypothetical protein